MNALLFGATSLIAQETARLWAARGDGLFLVARNAERLEAVAADLRTRGARVFTRAADLDDAALHAALYGEAAAALGSIDLVLLAHGSLGDQLQCQRDFAAAERVLRTNFVAATSLLELAAARFEPERRGAIVALGSVAGDRGRASNYVYGAAKAGLAAYLSGLRNRLAKSGVAVITVKPGQTDTPMTAAVKKGPLFSSAATVARAIVRGVDARQDVIYAPWWWRLVMAVIRAIPERVFKKLSL